MTRLEHDYTALPVCPHCGHAHKDYWEFSSDRVYDCEICAKEFDLTIHTSIAFTTEKLP